MMKQGSWWVKSVSDPRWDDNGRGEVGMLGLPKGAENSIDRMKERLKIELPKDIEYGYMKD